MTRLVGLRRLGNLRLNQNLFQVFISPLYRMGLVNCKFTTSEDRRKFEASVRRNFKLFVMIPINTPNRILKMMLGDVEMTTDNLVSDVQRKWAKHKGLNCPKKLEKQEICKATLRFYPKCFRNLLELLYCRVCSKCELTSTEGHLQ
jgi:hypothetical protein